MFLGHPLFAGRSDLEQLPIIYEKLGVPDDTTMPGVNHFKGFSESKQEFNKMKA
jgi:hypothetical protein